MGLLRIWVSWLQRWWFIFVYCGERGSGWSTGINVFENHRHDTRARLIDDQCTRILTSWAGGLLCLGFARQLM